jgi:hypothetical protein
MNDVFELISIESGARIRLAGPPETWSPDGREFAFIRWNRGTASDRIDVAVARVATGETRTVASLDVDGEAYSSWYNLGVTATWSPDGDRIAFAAAVDGPRSEIFVVELQAASVSQLTSSEAGESAVHPEWSPDGRHLAFLRSRFRLPVSFPGLWDIWAMLADGTAARPLSEPFPDGGSNVGAAWTGQWHGNGAAGTPVTAIRTPLRAEAGMRGVGVDDLAADRDIAVADVSTPGASCARVGAWSPRLGRWLVLTAKAVVDWCLFERADALGIAGLRAAWVYSLSDPHGEGGVCVLGQRLEPGVSSARVLGRRRAWHCPEPALRTAAFPRAVTFDDVRGDGSLLVYTAWRCGHPSTVLDCADRREPRLWRVTGSRSVPLGHGAAADVDAGRIVAMTTSGAVRILNRDGRVLRTLPLGGATSAQLSGHDLAVVRDEALEVWNVRTGRRRAAYPLERGFGPVPVVEDAERGIASVVVGVAIHLIRLSDGKDLVLDIENQAGPSHAELEPAGLFYSWNEPYTRMPGRLAFAPWGQIVTAFG